MYEIEKQKRQARWVEKKDNLSGMKKETYKDLTIRMLLLVCSVERSNKSNHTDNNY